MFWTQSNFTLLSPFHSALVFQQFSRASLPALSLYPSLSRSSTAVREITEPVNYPPWCLSRFRVAAGRPSNLP